MEWHLKHKKYGDQPWAVQAEALKRSDGMPRYGHWLQQGLGKTGTNINEFIDQDNTDLNIVIAPNSFKGDWPAALDEWGVDWMPSGMWPHDPLPFKQEMGLYAINYEAARGSAKAGLIKLMEQRRCMLTIDESKAISNPFTDTARAVIEIAKRATVVRELNGTPITQNVMDYYPQLRALGELNGVNPYAFRNRYGVMGGFMGRVVVGIKNEDELAGILDRCTFRALKKDWRKDLPPQVAVPVHLEMTPNQQRHYRLMMEEFYTMIDGTEITVDIVISQMAKLRQISSCVLLDHGAAHWIEPPNKNPKVRGVLDIVTGGQGKAIVVYFHRASGDMLFEALTKAKLEPAWIRGGMKPAEIKHEKDRFNGDTSCRVLLGQQNQTSRGHTLIGEAGNDRCFRTVYYENDFSLYQRAQMDDRNHRGEQDETCYIYDFVVSPVEQVVIDALVHKRRLADSMDEIVSAVKAFR